MTKRIASILFAALMLGGLLAGCGGNAAQSPAASAAPTAAPATPEPTAEPTPAPDPEAVWAQAGKDTMAWLQSQPGFEGLDLTVQEGFPYFLAVNRDANTVTVYTADENGQYTKPYMAMVCSGGTDTPTGYWNTPVNYDWRLLAGPCYGQYATRINGPYLFHSVPYYTQHKDDLEYDEFNKLGTTASLGCIRLAVVDARWIYTNCPIGTPAAIYDDAANPGPMGKPDTLTTDPKDETLRGWDPTDPDPANPWSDEYLDGTAIRSAAAQSDWEAFKASEAFTQNLTPTDLQGWSHDSAIVGTRG